MNAIIIYRHNGGWAFDDERYGLVAEALIEGADTLVDRLLSWRGASASNKALLRFSDGAYTEIGHSWLGHDGPWVFMKKVGESNGGTDYEVVDPMFVAGHRVWLCPALLCYYAVAPQSLTLDLRALPDVATAETSLLVSRAFGVRPSIPPSPTPL
jgi:hypothetical protein